jgi:hypothetical protein
MIVAGGSKNVARGAHTRVIGKVGDVYLAGRRGGWCRHWQVPDGYQEAWGSFDPGSEPPQLPDSKNKVSRRAESAVMCA